MNAVFLIGLLSAVWWPVGDGQFSDPQFNNFMNYGRGGYYENNLLNYERANTTINDLAYGLADKRKIPRGPKFTHEPRNAVFDVSGRSQQNYISLRCQADAHPTPTYTWLKEEHLSNNEIRSRLINPLDDNRLTQTDGTLTIYNPQQQTDRGKYNCRAHNEFGTIVSQTIQISFGFIGEFNKKRSNDVGKANWGKSISCDGRRLTVLPTVQMFRSKNANYYSSLSICSFSSTPSSDRELLLG